MTLIIKKPTGARLALKNYNAPAAIAGVAPTLDYRFALDRREIEAVSLTDKLTFTGENGTFVNQAGLIESASANTPRFNHNVLTLTSQGLIVEASSTNRTWPSNFSSNWVFTTIGDSTIQRNFGVSPSGFNDSCRISTGTSARVFRNFTSSGVVPGTFVISFFYKGDLPEASGPGSAVVDAGGSVTYPNGWLRYWRTLSFTGSGYLDLALSSGRTVELWGIQVEPGTTLTSPIITTTATRTRAADSATIDGTGVITGTYTMVEKPAGCAIVSGGNIALQTGFTAERVMVFPAALTNDQITAIRSAM